MAATTSPPPHHHHHHHNFWSGPGIYSLLDPFGFDPFLGDPFFGDLFLYEAQLGWFRTSDEKLRDFGTSDLERLFRSTSLEELVDEENRGLRRTKEKKHAKSKRSKVQKKNRFQNGNYFKNSDKAKQKTKVSGMPNYYKKRANMPRGKEERSRKRQRRSFGMGSMSWDELQEWRGNWGKKEGAETDGKRQNRSRQKQKGKMEGLRQRGGSLHKGRRRRRKEDEKTRQSDFHGRKVESFLMAIADKYGTLSPITTIKPGWLFWLCWHHQIHHKIN